MTTCRDTQTTAACFAPTAGGPHVSILHTTVFNAFGAPIAAYYHDEAATIIDPSSFMGGGTAVVGACPVGTSNIQSGGQNYASPSLAADYDPAGNGQIWTAMANLQSFTIIVRKAGAVPASANRVRVDTPFGKYFLVDGDVRTWSVAQDASTNEVMLDTYQAEAEGDSAFDVIWTVGA